VTIDSDFSGELILTIFHPKTALHDGGVITDGNPPKGELSKDRGYKAASVSGLQAKSGRLMNGHFFNAKLFSEVG
jgi:DisA bacterial checkpoint controller nucleotide-binding